MRLLNYIIFWLIFISFLNCSNSSFKLHKGQSPYSILRLPETPTRPKIQHSIKDSSVEITGIYCDKNIFIDKYPVIRSFNKKTGKITTPLNKKLNFQDGTVVTVKGKFTKTPIESKFIKKTTYYNLLNPDTQLKIKNTEKYNQIVTLHYKEKYSEISKLIEIKESKLELTQKPVWDIYYNSTEDKFLYCFNQSDLMYVINIEFIVDGKSENILDIYANQWFKGE